MWIKKLDWFVEEVNEKGDTTPFIIYQLWSTCSSSSLENMPLPAGSTESENFIIGIFHSASWPKMKEKLLADLRRQ